MAEDLWEKVVGRRQGELHKMSRAKGGRGEKGTYTLTVPTLIFQHIDRKSVV